MNRLTLADRMTEAQLQAAIRERITRLKLWAYHTHDSRRSDPGMPDLLIVGPGGILYRELKTRTGRLRPDQEHVLEILTTAGADAKVWRPADLAEGSIDRELLQLRRAPTTQNGATQ